MLASAFVNAAPIYHLKPLGSGYLECPQELRVTPKGKTMFCDLSAAVYARSSGTVFFAADWWKDATYSKLMSVQWKNGEPLTTTQRYHSNNRAFAYLAKIEAMTRTEDNRFMLATGAFSHSPETGYSNWASINSLVFWEDGKLQEARKPNLIVNDQLLPATSIEEDEYAYYLRNGMLNALRSKYPETDFFKVEGLSTLPGGRLAFGIREVGTHFTNAEYKNILLTTDFRINSNQLAVGTEFTLLHDFNINERYQLESFVGISSIEYDYNKHLLYMVTSYERGQEDEDVGAYFWVLPKSSVNNNLLKPRLVRNQASAPYLYAHKAEAMALDSQGRIILIADDDKVLGRNQADIRNPDKQFSRAPWRAAYTVFRIVPRAGNSALPH